MTINENFKEFIELLNFHKVEYLLIGGYAVGFYGYPRYTGDIDFWIAISQENAGKIIKVINDFGLASLGLTEQDFMKPDQVIQLGVEPNRIDIVTSVSGLNFSDSYKKFNKLNYGNTFIPVLDLESLKINKKSTGRNKDLNDIENLP